LRESEPDEDFISLVFMGISRDSQNGRARS
jgi:hypothetical protein